VITFILYKQFRRKTFQKFYNQKLKLFEKLLTNKFDLLVYMIEAIEGTGEQ